MTVTELMEVIPTGTAWTIGAEDGSGWIAYWDGTKLYGNYEAVEYETVTNIYVREGRENVTDVYGFKVLPLKSGLAIEIRGNMRGTI